jgi:cyclopropane fatty-acyl-phospholipid synthase-like methyltransferase
MRWVEKLLELLPDGSDVLELGCGGGSPATQRLAERHRVLGVDISPQQIELARGRVPAATFRCVDATELELPPASFDAVVSLYMLGHVPRAEQAPLLASIATWLRDGGYVLATMGTANADDEVDGDWLGAPMLFASFDEAANRADARGRRHRADRGRGDSDRRARTRPGELHVGPRLSRRRAAAARRRPS